MAQLPGTLAGPRGRHFLSLHRSLAAPPLGAPPYSAPAKSVFQPEPIPRVLPAPCTPPCPVLGCLSPAPLSSRSGRCGAGHSTAGESGQRLPSAPRSTEQ